MIGAVQSAQPSFIASNNSLTFQVVCGKMLSKWGRNVAKGNISYLSLNFFAFYLYKLTQIY